MASISDFLTSCRVPSVLILFCMSWAVAPNGADAQVVPAELMQRALAEGSVPVIVHLAVTTAPEGTLANEAAVLGQRHDIATAQQGLLAALSGHPHRVRHRYETVPFLALDVGPTALTLLDALRGLVLRVEEDMLLFASLAESVPLIQGNAAWDAGFTGSGKVVAIIDTGVETGHPFLAGKVVEEACFSGGGNCPNGSTSQIGPGAGVPCTYAASACQHGTHVAGIAAGLGSSFSGVAEGASIMSVQVFHKSTGFGCTGASEDPCATAFTSDIMAGLERVYALRTVYTFAAVNLSLGASILSSNCDTQSLKRAIDNLRSVGIATVASAGNDGFPFGLSFPACISTAVSVGSIDDGSLGTTANAVSPFSNSASFLSLLAPGRWINSSIPGGGFANFQGTSMAAPHVAGAWAILKQAKPSAPVSTVLSVLRSTGLPIPDFRNGITKPRIQVFQALQALEARQLPPSDFDADGLTDLSFFRPSTGTFGIINSSTGGIRSQQWGAPGDIAVQGDFDGDSRSDLAVFRPSDATWYIIESSTGAVRVQQWGAPGDIPVPGDYDEDGETDIAVFRPSTGTWYIINSSTGSIGIQQWGVQGDIPVPGDYDKDGRSDIAVFRPSTSTWYIINSSSGSIGIQQWGALGDVPVPADYDADGRTDVAVFRPSSGTWYIINSSTGSIRVEQWGASGDIPVPGDYEGDGRSNLAVFRPSTGTWYIINSTTGAVRVQQWGVNGDQPLPR